jgi:O-antigen/teichoic acid export membrane protein
VTESLQQRILRNGAASVAAQAIKLILMVGTGIVLARCLQPVDFGLVGIAFGFTGFLEIAKDGGLVVPVVQSNELTREQLDVLFWVNAGVGVALTAVSILAAPLIAKLFHEPRLSQAIPWLALTFLAGGVSTQHRALLRRDARFQALAICETAAMAGGCATAVVLALMGAGYWSLIWLYVTMEITQTVLTFSTSGWIPRWPDRSTPVRHLLQFGSLMMAFDFVGYMNFRFDNLVVGWYLGPAALGYYDKAYQILMLPVNQFVAPVSGVAFSELSRAASDPYHYGELFDRFLRTTTGLGMPLVAFLFANITTLVTLVLGPQWLPSVPVFQALAPMAFLMTVTAGTGWIFLSLGRAGRQLKWGVLCSAATVFAYWIGVRWGTVGVGVCITLSRVILFVPTLQYTCAGSPVTWTRILAVAGRPAWASLAALAASWVADISLGGGTWQLPRNALIFLVTYFAIARVPFMWRTV